MVSKVGLPVMLLVTAGLVAVALVGCSSGAGKGQTPTPLPGATMTQSPAAVVTQPASPDPAPAITSTSVAPPPASTLSYDDFLAQKGLVLERPGEQADVTGDGNPEVLLHARGRNCANCAIKTFLVMNGPDVIFEDLGEGWLAPLADGSGFERYARVPLPGEGDCCPSWFAVETHRWMGSGFEAESPIGLKHFLEVNQYPITAPLEPSVQVATVALYYDLVMKGQYDSAYALLSSGYRATSTFDDWRASFPRYATLFLKTVEGGGDVTTMNVSLDVIDIAAGQAGNKGRYEGTWTLVEESGVWKLESSMLDFTAP